jgi:hypothetical protein
MKLFFTILEGIPALITVIAVVYMTIVVLDLLFGNGSIARECVKQFGGENCMQ